MRISRFKRAAKSGAAFSIVEALVATTVIGFMFFSLYGGISSGFAVVQLARENLRATQILQEKFETLRLYNWNQVTNSGFIPTSFTDSFYPAASSSSGTVSGISYTGTVSIVTPSISETYGSEMREITVTLKWVSSQVLRTREMTSYVSRYGLQNYVY